MHNPQKKNDKFDFIKIQNFRFSKDIAKRMKRQVTDQEKIFTTHTSEKELISRIYKELLQLNNKRTNQFKNGHEILTDTSQKKMYK